MYTRDATGRCAFLFQPDGAKGWKEKANMVRTSHWPSLGQTVASSPGCAYNNTVAEQLEQLWGVHASKLVSARSQPIEAYMKQQ
jgi:hypothetical protein